MTYSRRDLSLLLPLLAAADAAAKKPNLQSKVYPFESMPVEKNASNLSRRFFDGLSHTGFPVECHLTEIEPGKAPHPPHHHVHDEMVLVEEGTVEVTISGRGTKIGPGGMAYIASNDEHGWSNVGTTRARYFIITLGRPDA